MDVKAYISSGLLENYCLGFCTQIEKADIEKYAEEYPEIKTEIESIRTSLEAFVLSNNIQPCPSVKPRLMLTLYDQLAQLDHGFAPLIRENMDLAILASWVSNTVNSSPEEYFENLFITELPSTEQVTNFIVHAKTGHENEMHENFIEYLYVIKGSCIMEFEGIKQAYQEGEIISVGPNINHIATVTSLHPMIALVQRQACA